MTSEDFNTHVAGHAGVSIREAADAVRVVLSGISGYLDLGCRLAVADELPPVPRTILLEQPSDAALPIEERMLGSGRPLAHARELIASVCHVLAEELSDDALLWLRRALPADLSRMLERPARAASNDERLAGVRNTLASGRPGSHHPIVDSPPPERRQSDSISEANPHGATKLSTSPGTTQERRHETLADAHPDPTRTLSTAKPERRT